MHVQRGGVGSLAVRPLPGGRYHILGVLSRSTYYSYCPSRAFDECMFEVIAFGNICYFSV